MYQIYQVEPNETIEIIANKLGIKIEELKRINGIGENSNLIGGNYIIVPSNTINNMNNPSMNNIDNYMNIPNNMNITEDYTKYIVKPGDNIYQIAKMNSVDMNTLLSLNGLNQNDYIYPNQEIVIPSRRVYVVKEKDTIKDIINNLNIDIEQIKDLYLLPDQTINY